MLRTAAAHHGSVPGHLMSRHLPLWRHLHAHLVLLHAHLVLLHTHLRLHAHLVLLHAHLVHAILLRRRQLAASHLNLDEILRELDLLGRARHRDQSLRRCARRDRQVATRNCDRSATKDRSLVHHVREARDASSL